MKFSVNVLFEDNHLLIVEKPAGVLTQGNQNEDGLEELLRQKHRFLHCVHRLDKPVSGIVVFAKSSKALSRLNVSQRESLWTKKYLARVEGRLSGSGTLKHHLIHGDHRAEIHPEGKLSILDYTVLEEGDTTLLEITLRTGRYHQIRAQLSAIGHPILGDHKYGSQSAAQAIALHHSFLSFPHPVKPELITIQLATNRF
ncbi:MAG: RluA family pseudouridine synthase [Chlamydiia bacterium]|nr:RluA family pseudouridine synthase [Chlamydiia bacterium]MCP5509662.1 RluA family pseudouridine synthase [Chlamydiales bacterium]HPE85652.1 RluA family pseudouridine synthase [Chlamydiales bacterium]